MGKKWIFLVTLIIFISLLSTLLLLPSTIGKQEAQANDYPWTDLYGFKYPDGYWSAKGVYSYSFYHSSWVKFSGTQEYWSSSYPCTNLSLRYRSWPTTCYLNRSDTTAKNNLPGNAVFVFMGHGNTAQGHGLLFYNGSTYSTLTASEVLALRNCDDIKFAFLLSCQSAADSNMAAQFRCQRGVDMVLGFTGDPKWKVTWPSGDTICYPAHVYNTEFWRALEINNGSTVLASMQHAVTWTNYHCNGSRGLQTHVLWGAENDTPVDYMKIVDDGRYEGIP